MTYDVNLFRVSVFIISSGHKSVNSLNRQIMWSYFYIRSIFYELRKRKKIKNKLFLPENKLFLSGKISKFSENYKTKYKAKLLLLHLTLCRVSLGLCFSTVDVVRNNSNVNQRVFEVNKNRNRYYFGHW